MTARRCAGLGIAGVAVVLMLPAAAAQQKPFVEHVEVARVLVDVRVFDERGRALTGLGPPDFAVKIGGKAARVESAEWVAAPGEPVAARDGSPPPLVSRADPGDASRASPRGRLIVFLVQRDLEPLRIVGLMRLGQLVELLMAPLTADDRIAVLSFDSRLRYWTDFTNDLERIRRLLARDVIAGRPAPVVQSGDVTLLSRLTPEAAARVYGVEHALRHVAGALEPLPGAKSVILLGYGFGRFDARSGSVMLMDGFAEASAALQRARVTVSALNVTQAHFNSLQAGLQAVAADTGGIYAGTYEFPERAVGRLVQILGGYYVLFVETPELRKGVHDIDVRLVTRRGTVMARSSYVQPR